MAEAEYLAKMSRLQATDHNMTRTKEQDLLIEKYKIEDSVWESHGVDTEHFLLLKYDMLVEGGNNSDPVNTSGMSTSSGGNSMTAKEEDEQLLR